MKQADLCILSLAEHREWRRAYELERKMVGNEMIGSESDTRLYEVFDKNVPDKGEATREIDGAVYTLETKKIGGARWWRAFLFKEKPAKKIDFVRHPLTGQLITTEQFALL